MMIHGQEKFTREEFYDLFPDGIPMVIMKLIFPEKSEPLTIGDIRQIARSMASPPPQDHVTGDIEARSTLWNLAINACAALIENNIIMDTSTGKFLAPRQDGNRDGLHYATAIRALATTEGQP